MDRQDLTQLLTTAMRGERSEDVLGGRVQPGLVKTRLLEAHPPESSADGSGHLLRGLAAAAGRSLEPVSEDLWVLGDDRDVFFVDALNPRFWLLHSTARAAAVESLVKRYFVGSPRIDSAWLPSVQLKQVEGKRRWIKSSFRSDDLQPNEDGADVPRRWRAQVEGADPDDFLELVRDSRYEASASLTAVGSVIRKSGIGRVEVAADYRGSFIASGSTFELVAGLLWRSLDRYENYVRAIEDRFQLRTAGAEDTGLSFDGDVAYLAFPHIINDLPAFVDNLFACREPFRLWAVPRQVAEHQWEARAVDLHVGHPLQLELTPQWIRVLLSEHTCGNTLARLIANLQHRFDARTDIALVEAA